MTTIAPPPQSPPAEPAPPPLTPGGRTALRVTLIVIAVVAVAGTLLSLGAASWGVSTLRVVADTKDLPSGMRTLVIDTGDIPAAVRIVTARDATVPRAELRLLKSARVDDHTLAVAEDGRSARLTVNGGSSPLLRWGRAGEITVTLPPDLARRLSVTTQQQDGVLFAQADLDELISRGEDGAVLLSGSARRIEIHNEDGSVISREPISVTESFTADTIDGEVSVDFKDAAPRRIEAVSSNGDVAIGLPTTGPYLVRATSGVSTTIRVPETSDPTRAAAEVTARSDDGAVTISTVGRDDFRRHR